MIALNPGEEKKLFLKPTEEVNEEYDDESDYDYHSVEFMIGNRKYYEGFSFRERDSKVKLLFIHDGANHIRITDESGYVFR